MKNQKTHLGLHLATLDSNKWDCCECPLRHRANDESQSLLCNSSDQRVALETTTPSWPLQNHLQWGNPRYLLPAQLDKLAHLQQVQLQEHRVQVHPMNNLRWSICCIFLFFFSIQSCVLVMNINSIIDVNQPYVQRSIQWDQHSWPAKFSCATNPLATGVVILSNMTVE